MTECRAPRDPCVVETVQLAGLVRSWVDHYERRMQLRDLRGQLNLGRTTLRGSNGHFSGRDPNGLVSGVTALARETERIAQARPLLGDGRIVEGVDGELVRSPPARATGVHPDKIRRILQVRHRSTELGTADLLVTAIQRPQAFYDGTLEVRPNPQSERRGECCGASPFRLAASENDAADLFGACIPLDAFP